MSRAERRVALPPKVYKMEGIAPAGMRKKAGVRRESDSSSMRAEVRRRVGKSGGKHTSRAFKYQNAGLIKLAPARVSDKPTGQGDKGLKVHFEGGHEQRRR